MFGDVTTYLAFLLRAMSNQPVAGDILEAVTANSEA